MADEVLEVPSPNLSDRCESTIHLGGLHEGTEVRCQHDAGHGGRFHQATGILSAADGERVYPSWKWEVK